MTGGCPPEVVSKDLALSTQTCPSCAYTNSANSAPSYPNPKPPTKISNPQPDPGPGPQPVQFQPTAGAPDRVSEEAEQRGKGTGQTEAEQLSCGAEERCCGVCKHLVLALVLVVLSPVIALGVCVADIVTGECCRGYDDEESEEDSEKD